MPSPSGARWPAAPVPGTSRPGRIRRAIARAVDAGRPPSADRMQLSVGQAYRAPRRVELRLPEELLAGPAPDGPVVRPLPRRRQADLLGERSFAPPRMPSRGRPRVGLFRTLRRLLTWIDAIAYFQLGTLADVLARRDSEERRAVRLRRSFERIGGTFVKIGQQMASRLDLLPQRYCEELASMLDRFPPFPTEQAIAIIERATGRPLADSFSAFDPEPIGSASVACVYQARLRKTGVLVAVKVRRPDVERLFEADFRVLDLLCWLAEALTIVRPGFTDNLRYEFRATLGSELDFRREGRLGELFRRRARKDKERWFSAPRLHYEFSSDDLLVQEFVSGMWLWELLEAIERRDPAGLARMRELDIDPRVVARRLLQANYWSLFNHVAFHADPHPANIVVQANNRLVFVDFGASGHLNRQRRLLYQRVFLRFLNNDAAGMAQASLMLSEPLPAIDLNTITKELEAAHINQLLAMRSKQTPWYERTSASMFIATINIMMRHRIPAPSDILMFARASLLYDTLAARLNPKISYFREFRRFARRNGTKTGRRVRKGIRRRLTRGLTASDYETMRDVAQAGSDMLFRVQRLLSAPYDFAVVPFVVEKGIFVAMTALRFLWSAGLLLALPAGALWAGRTWFGPPLSPAEALARIAGSTPYLVALSFLALMRLRVIAFRLQDKTRAE